MTIEEINYIKQYFEEYSNGNNIKKYYHINCNGFKILISDTNTVYQLNTDHEVWGIELSTIDKFKTRFESFTGEKLEDIL